MWTVYKAGGAVIPSLADHNGQKYSTTGTGYHGEKRVKTEVNVNRRWLDTGAKDVMLKKRLGIAKV